MRQNVETLIVKTEEYINSSRLRPADALNDCPEPYQESDAVIFEFNSGQKKKIDDYLEQIERPKTQPDFVCEKMSEKGFVYQDGQLNFVKFYTYARINPDVWHTFITQKHKASEDTMFKIIFALRLSEEEAEEFLGLGGLTFNRSNEMHKYILACMNTNIYDADEVYEVLNFYKVHNIYAEKKSRKECK